MASHYKDRLNDLIRWLRSTISASPSAVTYLLSESIRMPTLLDDSSVWSWTFVGEKRDDLEPFLDCMRKNCFGRDRVSSLLITIWPSRLLIIDKEAYEKFFEAWSSPLLNEY